MQSGRALRRKKTNLAPALKNAVTMYAPGTFKVPYGANAVSVGGRGASGNSPSGGNYAGGGNRNTLMFGYSYTDFYDYRLGYHVYSVGDDPWGPSNSQPPTRTYTANYNDPYGNTGSYYPGYSIVYYTVSGYNPGNYNPTYYNPVSPGNSGATATIGGVTFPGGTRNANTAPLVAPTMSTFTYKASGIAITVPPGGFVTLTPIG